jgi:hypothetical protein
MVFSRRYVASLGALWLALAAPSPSHAQSGGLAAQSGVAVFWDAGQCIGGYHATFLTAHCEPGPTAVILDFKTKTQFFCVNDGAVDIRWAIPTDAKPGSLVPPTEIVWRPGCWKAPFGFEVDPNAMILTPQYSQSPPPNYYMTMNVVVLYDPAKPSIKVCLVPLFPKFAVAPACGDAEIRS